jgi:hypothetical protein
MVCVIDIGSELLDGECGCSDEMSSRFLKIIHDLSPMWTIVREMSEYIEVHHPNSRVVTRVMHGCAADERVLGSVAPSVAHVDFRVLSEMDFTQHRGRSICDSASVTLETYGEAVEASNQLDASGVCAVMRMKMGSVDFVREDSLPDVIRPERVSIIKDIQCITRVTSNSSWVVSIRWKWTQATYEEAEASLLSMAPLVTLRLVRTGLEHVVDAEAEARELLLRVFLFLYGGPSPPTSSVLVPARAIDDRSTGK